MPTEGKGALVIATAEVTPVPFTARLESWLPAILIVGIPAVFGDLYVSKTLLKLPLAVAAPLFFTVAVKVVG